jgi:hypothetical protein
MAELATSHVTDEISQRQQAWCVAFYKGTFWEYIRFEHKIDMLSEKEYISAHREELIKAGCKIPNHKIIEPFDFSKIEVKQFVDPANSILV